MGSQVHRQGLIQHTELNGSNVIVDMPQDSFAVSMLEQHLQLNYPMAHIQDLAYQMQWKASSVRLKIAFTNKEDAIHFHLSHSD
jgi:hypothetical protein